MVGYDPQYYHKWYTKKSELKLKWVNKRLKLIKYWYDEFKIGKKCKKCKTVADKKHLKQFHYHHKDPEIKFNEIANMVSSGFSIIRIKEEMKKCIFLCSDCHHQISSS